MRAREEHSERFAKGQPQPLAEDLAEIGRGWRLGQLIQGSLGYGRLLQNEALAYSIERTSFPKVSFEWVVFIEMKPEAINPLAAAQARQGCHWWMECKAGQVRRLPPAHQGMRWLR